MTRFPLSHIVTSCLAIVLFTNLTALAQTTIKPPTALPVGCNTFYYTISPNFILDFSVTLTRSQNTLKQAFLLYEVAGDTAFTQRIYYYTDRYCIFDASCRLFADPAASDSIFTVRFAFPHWGLVGYGTRYYRARTLAVYSDRTETSPYSNIVSVNQPFGEWKIEPTVFPPLDISGNSFYIRWNIGRTSFGPQEAYIDLATDSLFTKILPQYNNKKIPDDQGYEFRFTDLQPNTRYYFRTRNSGTQGMTPYSATMSVTTLPGGFDFLAQYLSLTEILYDFPSLPSDACGRYYVYDGRENNGLSTDAAEALLNSLDKSGVGLDSAWFQDNGSCSGAKGGSELIIKTSAPLSAAQEKQLQARGFGNRQPRWGNECDCKNFRVYYRFTTTSVHKPQGASPAGELSLSASANPFGEETTLRYSVPRASWVTLEIVDALGRTVLTLKDGMESAGEHEARLKRSELGASGTYFARVRARDAAGFSEMRVVPLSAVR